MTADAVDGARAAGTADSAPAATDEVQWQRLSVRVVWVDIVVSLLSLTPTSVAVWGFGVPVTFGALWPLIFVAVFGVTGAVSDILRWAFTSYRVTPFDIERRTGLFVRRHRTLHRDRVRSVDTVAKLRHRLAGLRIVTVGAGQQTGAGESALVLDALSRADAAALRSQLLDAAAPCRTATPAANDKETGAPAASDNLRNPSIESVEVFATFRPRWVFYNMLNIWAFLMTAGLLWGAFWFLSSFGIDLFGFVARLAVWDVIGWVGVTLLVVAAAGLIGAIGLGVTFLLGYWRFELARTRSGERTYLRTRRGLLSTREVNRDESRMRGLTISEPVLWRWMGMADTNIITTGLNLWDAEEPAAILPRGPISVARRVARDVFGAANPFESVVKRHPRNALHRRLWWATALSAIAPLLLAAPAVTGVIPAWIPWATLGFWPIALGAAVIAYRALGHTIDGDYLVVRGGLFSRSTSVLRRDAVSTIAVRQSVLQRRIGLCTVSAMTAAGWCAYEAPDVPIADGIGFADDAAPGLLDGVLVRATPFGRG
ncbi:PH domain-containing protein [Leucobacter sp. wl10]|uniref:PH domain-containing protein n=1 Tax=Leucobacter sp. wl10 TaxID=2304677 RepID=UPI000E5B89BB|nr:PH domain-containing protein [Leucobacter sp. wl10]RGE23801.1 hypothetical protein D1J51_02265 [Leucobacter sp. wl10]